MRDVIIVKSDFDRFVEWETEFNRYDLEAIPWEQRMARAAEIKYALVWQPEPGSLATLPNLEVIFSVGAGVDHLKGENLVPVGVPVVRMVEDALTSGMVEYVVYNVLRFHREMPRYESLQKTKTWEAVIQIPSWERTVGILGLGVLGGAAALALKHLQFNVIGWSRGEKQIEGVVSYFGDDQLQQFLKQSQILVCLLPFTPATQGIVNTDLLNQLPKGAWFINAGRGPVVIEIDLIAALDNGQIAGAALDVFNTEPLPEDDPLWRHPGVLITPHVASITLPPTSAKHVINNIQRHQRGESLTHLADMSQGY